MTLLSIDTILRELLATEDIGEYNSLCYELLTKIRDNDFKLDIIRYSKLVTDSILPGEFQYDLHVEHRIHASALEAYDRELHYKFANLLLNIKPKAHAKCRSLYRDFFENYHKMITNMCSILFNPEYYKTQLRYYDGLHYCIPNDHDSNFDSLNYDHFFYRKLKDGTYYGTLINMITGEHSSTALAVDSKYVGYCRPLYNYLFPENAI